MTPEQQYIWDRIIPEPNSGCWLWMLADNGNGYGQMTYRQAHYLAHKFAYEAFREKVPTGLEICHKCDVRSCLNPDHMYVGTGKDNMRDAARRGRCRAQRLQPVDVQHIRGIAGVKSMTLADLYGVGKSAIERAKNEKARNGRRWAHVP